MEVTARDDIVSRAALVEPDLLPEPWGPEDEEALGELIDREIFRQVPLTDSTGKGRLPEFLIDYEHLPAVIPNALQSNHVRSSVATRWDANGDLVEDSADTLRLWRDPKTQAVEGLIYEPKRTQLFSSPTDFTSADWSTTNLSVTGNAGSAKGQQFDKLVESNDSSAKVHKIEETYTRQTEGDPVAGSFIVKADGRNWCSISHTINDDNASATDVLTSYFDLSNGVTGSTVSVSDGTVIEHSIKDLGNGWYKCVFVVHPDSSFAAKKTSFGLADGDKSGSYQGDGSSGIRVIHSQTEISYMPTTPILQGGGVRENDAIDYRFSFPNKTTGVAFSIKDESSNNTSDTGFIFFGTTSDFDSDHGVLMDGRGLNDLGTDGWKTVTRNSDDSDDNGNSPLVEAIDRFEVDFKSTDPSRPPRIIRQIAIHTAPHTSTQLSNLESNYLTTP